MTAAEWWHRHDCNRLATGALDDYIKLGRLINRGNAESLRPANGEDDRINRWVRARRVLALAAPAPVPAPTPAADPMREGDTGTPPAPVKEAPVVAPIIAGIGKAIILDALPSIVRAIPRLGSLFASSETAKRNVAGLEVVADTIATAVGARNAQETVEALQDPAKVEAARTAVDRRWADILDVVEAGGGGVAGSREWIGKVGGESPEVWSIVKIVTLSALGFLAIANVVATAVYLVALVRGGEQITAAMQLLGTVIQADIGAAMVAFGFWLEASWGSKQKTAGGQT